MLMAWITEVHVRGVPVKFKIDTGADVSVISEKDFLKVGKYPLQESDRKLHGPGKNELQVKGRFSATMSQMGKSSEHDIYVIKGLQQALLGRPAIEALRVVHKVDHVTSLENYTEQFPRLFQGLGKLKGPKYKIKLKADAQPYALTTPRRVPLPLFDKVKEELTRMQSIGVISKIDEPTEWCAGMVVVPKQNGKVHICIELTKLN